MSEFTLAIYGKAVPFGHIEDNVPEFAISTYPQYRGKGIGTALMRRMLEHLKSCGYLKTSLAVQKDNYAVDLYQKVGFTICDENEQCVYAIFNRYLGKQRMKGRNYNVKKSDKVTG